MSSSSAHPPFHQNSPGFWAMKQRARTSSSSSSSLFLSEDKQTDRQTDKRTRTRIRARRRREKQHMRSRFLGPSRQPPDVSSSPLFWPLQRAAVGRISSSERGRCCRCFFLSSSLFVRYAKAIHLHFFFFFFQNVVRQTDRQTDNSVRMCEIFGSIRRSWRILRMEDCICL
jgi:hypothetical protein